MENKPPGSRKPPRKKPPTALGDSIDYVAETAALVRSKATACRYGGGKATDCRKLEALAEVLDPRFEEPPPLDDGLPEPVPAPAKEAEKPSKSTKPKSKKAPTEVDEERSDDLDLEHGDEEA